MNAPSDILRLAVGSANTIDLYLFDERDEAEDLTGLEDPTVYILRAVGDSDFILEKSEGVTVEAGGIIRAVLTQEEADALVAGRWLIQASLVLPGDPDQTLWTEPAQVAIESTPETEA